MTDPADPCTPSIDGLTTDADAPTVERRPPPLPPLPGRRHPQSAPGRDRGTRRPPSGPGQGDEAGPDGPRRRSRAGVDILAGPAGAGTGQPGATERPDDGTPVVPPGGGRIPTRARRRSPRTAPDDSTSWYRFAAGGAFVVAFALVAYGTVRPRSADTSALGLVALPLLAVLVHQIVRRSASREHRFDLLGIMMLGLGLRCIGAFLRFSAPVDALVYHQEGSRIAPALRGLDFGVDTGRDIPGTGWIRYVSGLTHAFVIDDMFVTFVIFTFLSFVGAFLCYRAFVLAVPEGDHKRYALLIFLWPALVYWPSSIGKEAWMLLGLGIASWGIARTVTGRATVGLPITVLGLTVLSLVRPHVALMVLVGLGVAMLARPTSRSSFRIGARIVIVLVLLVGGAIIVARTSEVLKIDLTGAESVTTALAETQEQTDQGGARFTAAAVRTPIDYPVAFVTVWFRPLPIEVRDATGLLSAAENVALIVLVVASWRRLLGLPRNLIRLPYGAYAAAYSLVFVYAFSVIANFGILARQRTQGLVLFFVLLCIPAMSSARAPQLPGRERAHRDRPSRRLAREQPAPTVPDLAPDPPSGPATGPSASPGVRRRRPAQA